MDIFDPHYVVEMKELVFPEYKPISISNNDESIWPSL